VQPSNEFKLGSMTPIKEQSAESGPSSSSRKLSMDKTGGASSKLVRPGVEIIIREESSANGSDSIPKPMIVVENCDSSMNLKNEENSFS